MRALSRSETPRNRPPPGRRPAATGALAVGPAAALTGSVASRFVDPPDFKGGALRIEHPAGAIPVTLELGGPGEVKRASLVRTARRIFEGNVLVPESAFA